VSPSDVKSWSWWVAALAVMALGISTGSACGVDPKGLAGRDKSATPGSGGAGGSMLPPSGGAGGDDQTTLPPRGTGGAGGTAPAADASAPADTASGGGAGGGASGSGGAGAGGSGGPSGGSGGAPTDGPPPMMPPPPDAAPPPRLDGPPAGPGDGPATAARALLLVGELPLTGGDSVLASRLEQQGFRLTTKLVGNQGGDVDVAAGMAASFQVVVLTVSLPDGGRLARLLASVPVPIVCAKRRYFEELGISPGNNNDDGVAVDATQVSIIAPNHPLAADRNGLVTVTSRPAQMGWGRPVPGATRVATLPGQPDRVVIFAVDRSTATTFEPAPARRVGFFALEFGALNPAGWALFDAAMRWALAAP
jgi:hypothetical protein